ncbi:MAG: mechanosensitive ion channel family protein [Myxococcales bacterium]|nr:mechanosensitive ion channel family protein [Myxococcales bacterium]
MEVNVDSEQISALAAPLIDAGVDVGTRAIGAVLLWLVGRWLIGLAKRMTSRAMDTRHLDPTLIRYVDSALGILLNVVLVIGILSVFGVETTTFAGLLAAAGVAIGMAWSGLLANFAAGAFLMVLRPFKVGDFVEAAGVLGTIAEIGLFATTIQTPDNIRTFVGNNAIFSGTIRNFTANAHRRVDLVAQMSGAVDPEDAIARLQRSLAAIPNVVSEPAPVVEILEYNPAGYVLCVRPSCHNDHYWQVYFDTNKAIRAAFADAGYPGAGPTYYIRQAG